MKLNIKNKKSQSQQARWYFLSLQMGMDNEGRSKLRGIESIWSNKKSAVGSTLTWIVATLIIIFILALYFVFLAVIYEKNNIAGEALRINYAKTDVSGTKFLISFLKSDAGNSESVYDLLKKAGDEDGKETEREKTFETIAENALKNYYPNDYSTLAVKKIVNGEEESFYTASYDAMFAVAEAPEIFSNSISITLPIPENREINLFVNLR